MNDILHVYLLIIDRRSTVNSKEKCRYVWQVNCVKHAKTQDLSDPYFTTVVGNTNSSWVWEMEKLKK